MREIKYIVVYQHDSTGRIMQKQLIVHKAIEFFGSYSVVAIREWTGRKDKNDVDIYEGDIVKTYWQHDGVTCYDYELIGEIRYMPDNMCFSLDCTDQIITLIADYEREELHDIEVIGNVYDNQDLLK